MLNPSEDISRLFLQGAVHVFRGENRFYLYLRSINRFFEIDEEAFTVLNKIRNGNTVDPSQHTSFFQEWATLKVENAAGKRIKNLRIYFNEQEGMLDLENMPEIYLYNADKWQVIVQAGWGDPNNSKNYISEVLAKVKALCTKFRINAAVTIKVPAAFLTTEYASYLKNLNVSVIVQEAETVANTIDGAWPIESKRADFDGAGIVSSFKNFIVLDKRVTLQNYPSLQDQILKSFTNGAEHFVPESFQNIFFAYNFLTSKSSAETYVITPRYRDLKDDDKGTPCGSCWARNLCRATAIYETFGSHPYEINKNSLNCQLIYKVAETIINLINNAEITVAEKFMYKYELDYDEEKVIHINP
jgi:hypothetical protein